MVKRRSAWRGWTVSVVTLGVAAMLMVACEWPVDTPAQTEPTNGEPTPTATQSTGEPMLPADVPFLPPGGPAAASALQADPRCSDTELRNSTARLTWTPAASPGAEQRVVVAFFADSLQRGAVPVSGPLAPDQAQYTWERLSAGINYYWWVLTRQPQGWAVSEPGRFEARVCIADLVDPPSP